MSISLKKILLTGTALVAMNYATQAYAATVVVGNLDEVFIETDPDASTAISFTGAEGGEATVDDGVNITGKVITANDGIGVLQLNGTTTVSGNVGTADNALNEIIIGGEGAPTATFSGAVFAYDISLGDGEAFFNGGVTLAAPMTFQFTGDADNAGEAYFAGGTTMTGNIDFDGHSGTVNFADGANMNGDIYNGGDPGYGNVNFAGNSTFEGSIGGGNRIEEINIDGGAGTTVNISGDVFTDEDSGTIYINGGGTLNLFGDSIGSDLEFDGDGVVNWAYAGGEGEWGSDIFSDGYTAGDGIGSLDISGENAWLDGSVGWDGGEGGGIGILKSITLSGENSDFNVLGDFYAADTTTLNGNTIEVGGDFILSEGQTLDTTITDNDGGIGNVDALNIETAYVEAGAIVRIRVSTDDYIGIGEEYTIVSGGEGTIGGVDIISSPLLTFEQVEDDDNLSVEVTGRTDIADVVGGGNGGALGDIIDEQCSSEDGCDGALKDLENRLLSAENEEELEGILEGAAPDVGGGANSARDSFFDVFFEIEQERIASLRSGDGMSGMAAGAAVNGAGMWLQGYGQTAQQDLRDGIAGYDSDTLGTAIGVDSTNIIKDGILGFAFNYGRTNVDSKNVSTTDTDIDNYGFTFYGSHDYGQKFFVNAQAGYAYNKIDSTRHDTGGPGTASNADYSSDQYAAKILIGRDCAMDGGVTLTPNVSAAYTHLDTEGYTETGTGLLLTVGDETFNSFKLGVGAKASWNLKNTDGSTMKPDLRVGYAYDTIGDNIEATASFVGGGGSFTTTGADPARSSFIAGAGLTYATTANWELSANYDYTYKADYDSHAGVLRATAHF